MMRTKIRAALILAGISVVFAAPSAWAIAVDLVGAGTYSMATGTPTNTAALGFPGGGLILDFRLGSKVDFALGGLYLTRVTNQGTAVTHTMVQGLGGFRLMASRAFFVELGGYYNYRLTDPESTLGQDYGVYGGIGIRAMISNSVAFFLSPRYHYCLNNAMTNANGTIAPHEIVGLVGLTFGMAGMK